jgi:hypothetical protein
MSCLQVHDFITGTTITLPRGGQATRESGGILDIVRPNEDAAALVSDHLARICALQTHRAAARRRSKITAIAC